MIIIDFLSNTKNLGSVLILIGSFYIVFGHFFGSGKEIFQRCHGDMNGMSEDLYIYLDKQRIEAIIGFVIIFVGFLFQLLIGDLKYYGLIIVIIAILLPILILITTDRRQKDIIKNMSYYKNDTSKKKPWFVNYIIDTIKDVSNFLKLKTNLDLYYWIFLFLFIVGTIYFYLHKNDGILTEYILWITFIAILWYSKETYWLKQVQQKALNLQKEKKEIKNDNTIKTS